MEHRGFHTANADDNTLDKELRAMARKETVTVPNGFEERMEQLRQELSAGLTTDREQTQQLPPDQMDGRQQKREQPPDQMNSRQREQSPGQMNSRQQEQLPDQMHSRQREHLPGQDSSRQQTQNQDQKQQPAPEMAKTSRRRSRKTRRLLVAAAAILVIGTATAAASPVLLPMAQNTIAYFSAPEEFRSLSGQAAFEEFNAGVGVSTEDQSVKLTVDNIAVSDNYINVFYTVTSQEPIVLGSDSGAPESWQAGWAAPHFWFKADGAYIEPSAQGETEAYLKDSRTLVGMQRFAVMASLPDTFGLELYTSKMLGRDGDWHIALGIDKSSVAAETLTVSPNRKLNVAAGDKSYRVTVEKVSISPFGSQIVLKERTGTVPFCDFILRDDKGADLPVIPASLQSNALFSLSNSFEFLNGRIDAKSITLIPFETVTDAGTQQSIALDHVEGAKVATSNLGGVRIDSVSVDRDAIIVEGTPYGSGEPRLEFFLTDEAGESLPLEIHMENRYDRETGKVTCVMWLPEGLTDAELSGIRNLTYFSQNLRLLEDQAVTIPLH